MKIKFYKYQLSNIRFTVGFVKQKIKILFIRWNKAPFVQNDLFILKKHFDIQIIDFYASKTKIFENIGAFLKLFRTIIWADLTFTWFVNIHAFAAVFLSKLFGKKSVVVVGGYEVANVPELKYGYMSNPIHSCMVKHILENANIILAVSEFNKKEILRCITKPKNVKLLYHGVDCNKFTTDVEKDDIVVTIGRFTKKRYKLKGMDTFINTASAFPHLKFVVIGPFDRDIINRFEDIGSNVEFTGIIPHDDVVSWLKRAKIYCQLSFRESFGLGIAESMLCECVPIITRRGAIPEVVGDTGVYVPYGDVNATIDAIGKALKSDKGKAARKRIKDIFSIEEREKKLVEVIRKTVDIEK